MKEKIMAYFRSIIVVFVLGVYVACAPVKFDENLSFVCNKTNSECYRVTASGVEHVQRINSPGKEVDILFVIDNSGSMSFEQKKIANRFSSFLTQLDGHRLNYHIGLTTTDISSSDNKPRTINQNGALQDGKLIELRGSNNRKTGKYIIKSDQSSRVSYFNNTVKRQETSTCEQWLEDHGNTGALTEEERRQVTDSCPAFDERGIVAADKAVQRNEHGFLRNGAHLAVVIVSDEDERSVGPLADPESSEYDSDYAGYKIQDEDRPETFIANFRKKYGVNKTLAVHSIIVRTGDDDCLSEQNSQANRVKGFYGTFYERLSNITNGVVGDVCATDYSSQLRSIGSTIVDQTKTADLYCSNPENLEVVFLPAQNAVPYTVEGNRIEFSSYIELDTSVTITYKCPPSS